VVGGLKSHSKKVSPGDVFYVMGEGFCAQRYLPEVLDKKPAELVVPEDFIVPPVEVPVRLVPDVRKVYREDCQKHYQELFESFELWGITGTKGKTTIAWGLYQFLISQGICAAYIGTLGVESQNFQQSLVNTTPGLEQFIEILERLKMDSITHVVCEVSSQGLIQERVPIPFFQVRAFTDLSEEHLDAHGNMDSYFQAKNLFFSDGTRPFKSFVLDRSEWGSRLSVQQEDQRIRYGLRPESFPSVTGVTDSLDGISLRLNWEGLEEEIHSPWIGFFNGENLLCILSILLSKGFSLEAIKQFCETMPVISGRMERVASFRGAGIYVDYAHSSQSLEYLLEVMSAHTSGRLHVLFGCGGERDSSKRPRMARACAKWAQRVIVTQDNPRGEDPEEIISQILQGFPAGHQVSVFMDRGRAIYEAVKDLKGGDILLVAGKGHEDYQIIGNKRLPFSDPLEITKSIQKLENEDLSHGISQPKHSLNDFIESTGSSLIREGNGQEVCAFHFDSRKISHGECFVALQGTRHDGHIFIHAALEQGASWILGSKLDELEALRTESVVIYHPDPQQALLEYARFYRRKTSSLIIGITGSCGKTTTKDCLRALLGKSTYANPGNFNNDLGLPISLLGMPLNIEFGVFELGINAPGEMKVLSRCLVPDIALITNIEESHREFFPTRRDLIREKLSIASKMDSNGVLFVSHHLLEEIQPIYEDLGFPPRLLPLHLDNLDFLHRESKSSMGDGPYQSLLMASALARNLGLGLEERKVRVGEIILSPLRMEHRQLDKTLFVLDCYNASPRSMESFFSSFTEPSKTVLVLADMLELGANSQILHMHTLKSAHKRGFQRILLLGDYFQQAAIACGIPQLQTFENMESLISELIRIDPEVIGLKGSRGFALEKIYERIAQKLC